ncbi:serine hydrolase [Sagittula sp. MA-2]|jgi:CubicO group peptidase (beta-lactamase class C family)|uniref:serine hydrolase domain-containing protein n=1 Tax=Sagittula sp. MA-2 TaxID=3048007 RepID=UPI0024C425D5|nr:serine hydrolase [Sagittula sp. MA-2]WHZ37414.1 serine hydrolase [Sagittula sp. MA-2]
MQRRTLLASALALPFVSRAWAQDDPFAAFAEAHDQFHAILVRKGDTLIHEKAYRGPGLDALANIKSCSKSMVALLLGCAIDRDEVALDATLGDVAPRLIPSGADPQVADITLGDLASLRAGLERTSGPNYGAWVASSNWVRDALSRPMVAEPGGRMLYSTGSTHVLGAALAEATGLTLLEQARTRLGRPLGIDIPPWTRDPQGYYLGGNQMALTPRAMLRVALTMRDGGVWDGTQVIPADWVETSVQPLTRSPYSGLSYGYGWFLSPTGWALARGYGGQIIAFHADRDIAAAITSDPNRPARSQGYFGALMDLLDGPVLSV